ncbi:MAG: hypothetical protein KAR06_02960 [Deltaproteobacteria bacterium]|nr:hypothetical protein [Deltaproteobacteria bacterium]
MAITEETKQIVHNQFIPAMKSRWRKLKADRDQHIAQAQVAQSEMDNLKTKYEALIADVPEPTPPPGP